MDEGLDTAIPLQTSFALLCFLGEKTSKAMPENELARRLNNFLASSHLLEDDKIAPLEDSEMGYHHADHMVVRHLIGAKFPGLGLYWKALDPIIRPGKEA